MEDRQPTASRHLVRSSPISWYFVSAGIVGLLTLVCYPLKELIGYQSVSLLFLLAVAILPLRMGVGPVLLAAALSALSWDFFFIPPFFTLHVESLSDLLMLITYSVVATSSAVLISRVRRREETIRIKESRTTALFNLSRELAGVLTEDAIVNTVIRHVSKIFSAPVAFFPSHVDGEFSGRPHGGGISTPDESEWEIAGWAYWNEQKAGRWAGTLTGAEWTYYPVSGPRYPLGVLALRWPAPGPTRDHESLLQAIIDQASACLEREQLHVIARDSLVHAESERLASALFSSVSHELRTPLASIVGSAETLATGPSTEPIVAHELARQIHASAVDLHHFVENLLDMSRLESGQIRLKRDWTDLEDLVRTAIRKTAEELGARRVNVALPGDLPPIKLDAALMEQVLVNLLRNAARHTPERTTLSIAGKIVASNVELVVEDDGPGFPPKALPRIFEKFYRVPGARAHGTGLGLSIAKGFVEAHGGRILAANREGGGARFLITFPAEVPPVLSTEALDGNDSDRPGR
jgi:two-component system, OmpR family, sensor histidine kinase KdpD